MWALHMPRATSCSSFLLPLSRGSSWDINSLPMCSHLPEEQSSQQPEKLRQPLMGTLWGAGMVYPLHPLSPPVSEKLSTHPRRVLMEPPVAQGLVEHSRCFLRTSYVWEPPGEWPRDLSLCQQSCQCGVPLITWWTSPLPPHFGGFLLWAWPGLQGVRK